MTLFREDRVEGTQAREDVARLDIHDGRGRFQDRIKARINDKKGIAMMMQRLSDRSGLTDLEFQQFKRETIEKEKLEVLDLMKNEAPNKMARIPRKPFSPPVRRKPFSPR